MQLTFNSTEDLDLFLNWANLYRAPGAAMAVPPYPTIVGPGDVAFDTPPADGHSVFTEGDGSPADLEAKDLQVGPYAPAVTPPEQPANTDGPVKRTRRTKAEIEAAKAALASAAPLDPNVPNAGEAALEAARKVLHDKAGLPSGTNPFEQHGPAAGAEGATTNDEGSAEPVDTTVTPFQHLTRAREFIGKHGMPKYNESFVAAGLDPNVMGYTAEQRVAHIAALDALEAS